MNSSLTKLVNLTPEEVLHLSKPREGFLEFAEPMIAIYTAHIDEMRIKGITPEHVRELLAAYQELLQMEKNLQKQLAMCQATRALRGSNLWDVFLRVYGHASVASHDDIEIERDIVEFENWMKNGPRKKPVVAPTEPTPTPVAAAPVAVAATPATADTNEDTSTTAAPTTATTAPPIPSK